MISRRLAARHGPAWCVHSRVDERRDPRVVEGFGGLQGDLTNLVSASPQQTVRIGKGHASKQAQGDPTGKDGDRQNGQRGPIIGAETHSKAL
jgi:hypothetical protein